jgi:hypothetical protein
MAKQTISTNSPLTELGMTNERLDIVAGPVHFNYENSDSDTFSKADSLDYDVNSHISYYITQLPNQLDLKALSQISIEDPQAALVIINALRANVDRELQKAKTLRSLYYSAQSTY